MSFKKWVAAFDIHGDKQDKDANKALFRFIDHWKPDIRILGGDLFDFRPLRKKASEDEKAESMKIDFSMGMEWLSKFEPTYYLRGNHCERLWDLAELGTGVVRDAAESLVSEVEGECKRFRCQIFPYSVAEGMLRIGKLKVIHGFGGGSINAARRAAQIYGAVLQGHIHCIQHVTIEGLEPRMGRVCGCLCQLHPDYARACLGSLAWAHGWAYGVINDRTGDYQVWQAQKVGGQWLLPTGFEVL